MPKKSKEIIEKSGLDTIIDLLKDQMKKKKKKFLSQEEVYDYLDKIHVQIEENEMDEVFSTLMKQNILLNEVDLGDEDYVGKEDLRTKIFLILI
ncbi:hypothetical protein ACLRE7_00125 [Mycoplasmopsis meleagridis]|uniref:hypothetical protein n=1 Tax=Mycoplasmopsis meleagridis TaxID=29561 RepID=UPI003A882CC6